MIFSILFSLLFNSLGIGGQAQIPEFSDFDDSVYFGQELGVSGILDTLIDYISRSDEDASFDKIQLSIDGGLNYIWENRFIRENQKIAAWSKGPDQGVIYPGIKYGAAGIGMTFLKYFETTDVVQWLDKSIEVFNQLISDAVNNDTLPHWAYSYINPQDEGIPISDLKYGSSGVAKFALELYLVTLNDYYLLEAEKIISWLNLISVPVDVGSRTYNLPPWYHINEVSSPIKLGYNWGISGIIPLIYQIGSLLNSTLFTDWAYEMADFLFDIQQTDGSWNIEYNPNLMYSDQSNDLRLSNFDEGVVGILKGLYLVSDLSGSNRFDPAITGGIQYLFSQFDNSLNDFIKLDGQLGFQTIGYASSDFDENHYFSLYRGLLGYIDTLGTLIDFLSNDQSIKLDFSIRLLFSTGTFLIQNGNEQLLFLQNQLNFLDSGIDQIYIDLSLAEGTTGLLKYLLGIDSLITRLDSLQEINIDTVISSTISGLLFFQNIDGSWNRQRTLPTSIQTTQIMENPNVDTLLSKIPTLSSTTKTSAQNEATLYYLITFISILIVRVIASKKIVRFNIM